MKKITLKEKIELITAYAEGKPVDAYDTIFQRWFEKGTDTWDFDREEYRIKPNEAAKFAVGDILVCKSDEGSEVVDRYEVTEVGQEYYRLDDMVSKPCEATELEFVNERKVLWYFEIYDYVSKTYFLAPTRRTMEQMDKEYASNHDTHKWLPVYHLGFKLKEN